MMTIAHYFKRPGMYIGTGFETMSEFRVFMATLVLAKIEVISEAEKLAIRYLSRFVVQHYHGSFENKCWADELRHHSEGEEDAIDAGMICTLELAAMIRSQGAGKVEDVLDAAQEFVLVPSADRPGRLATLIDEAIEVAEAWDITYSTYL